MRRRERTQAETPTKACAWMSEKSAGSNVPFPPASFRDSGTVHATVQIVWVRRAAIRPVPPYARVPPRVLGEIEADLADEDEIARDKLDGAFSRFEATQPAIAERVANALGRPIDETALALGYFLTLAIWLAFERNFEGRLAEVLEDELAAAEQSLTLDEELRRVDPAEAVDSDDVVAMEQPDLLSF